MSKLKMADEDSSVGTSCLVADYLSYRLQKSGYTWQISPTRNSPNDPVTDVMRKLCVEFEKRYEKTFAEMCSECERNQLTAENYRNVLDDLIVDGIHWGRVVGIFAYAGAMAVYSMKNDKKENVDLIREWTTSYISSRVENWVNQNNGWRGLVDFYENGLPKQDEHQNNNGWGYLIGGALGAFALGALIINKA